MTSWAVFLSGRGSNAGALFESLAELDIRLVLSNKPQAYGLLRAQRAGIPTLLIDKKTAWSSVSAELRARKINRLFLLGFMKLVPAVFVQEWKSKIWNLHPSLLPAFPGLEALEKSYAADGPMGVSLHEVTADMDAGPLQLQKKICDFSQRELSFEAAQLKISQTEQRLVRELAQRKNREEMAWT